MSIKVICVDNKNYPKDFPISKIPELGEEYTVIGVKQHPLQKGAIGLVIEELILTEDDFPYGTHAAYRFVPKSALEKKEEEEEEQVDDGKEMISV